MPGDRTSRGGDVLFQQSFLLLQHFAELWSTSWKQKLGALQVQEFTNKTIILNPSCPPSQPHNPALITATLDLVWMKTMAQKPLYTFMHFQSLRCNGTLAAPKLFDLSSRISSVPFNSSSVIYFELTEVRLHLSSSSFFVFLQTWRAQVTRPEQGVHDGLTILYSKLATTARLLGVEIGPSATSIKFFFFFFSFFFLSSPSL